MKKNADTLCYTNWRNTEQGYAKISIEYERPYIKVFFYDHNSSQFMHCFTMEKDLDFEGFFVIAGSSGRNPSDHNYLNSFKLFDPLKAQTNHHYQDAHDRKSMSENLADTMALKVQDLIAIHSKQGVSANTPTD